MKNKIYNDVVNELKVIRKESFESKLAASLIQDECLRKKVAPINKKIIGIMQENAAAIKQQIAQSTTIQHELYSPTQFGHLAALHTSRTNAEEIFADILEHLKKPDTALYKLIHIHAVFIQKIFSPLVESNENFSSYKATKNYYANIIFNAALFKERGRIEINKPINTRTAIGINHNKVLAKQLNQHFESHQPALFRFRPNADSTFFKLSAQQQLPFVAGPSGHTGSLLLGAAIYSAFDEEGLKNYALACFAYLSCGGNHSFHEVMIVANTLGIPFSMKNYSASFSETLRKTKYFEQLQEEYPDLLPPHEPEANSHNRFNF